MHKEVKEYISKIKEKYPEHFKNKKVLELGSLDVNGTPREFFKDCEYVGVDIHGGTGVDIISRAHEVKGKYDVIISTEMLEHDKFAEQSIENAWNNLNKGGLIIMTAANINREPHYEFIGEDSHYENISSKMVKKILPNAEIEEDDNKLDIRFSCLKPI